ncbi:MAG TPA: formyltransferase family protein [Stellaceae bacterium]
MRLAFFLNGDRGEAVLSALVEQPEHAIVRVVRGRQDVNGRAFVADLAETKPDLLVVAGYPTIFKRPLLSVARLGVVNLHAGRLPQYRGGSPLNWQMINGESVAGFAVLQMDEGIDTGAVWISSQLPIGPRETIMELHARANRLFPPLTLEALAMIAAGCQPTPQDAAQACYWHQRSRADGRLDFARSTAAEADRFIRALTGSYGGAWCHRDGAEVKLWRARVPERVIRGNPGRVCRIERAGPYVVCADRAILIEEYEGTLRHGDVLG